MYVLYMLSCCYACSCSCCRDNQLRKQDCMRQESYQMFWFMSIILFALAATFLMFAVAGAIAMMLGLDKED